MAGIPVTIHISEGLKRSTLRLNHELRERLGLKTGEKINLATPASTIKETVAHAAGLGSNHSNANSLWLSTSAATRLGVRSGDRLQITRASSDDAYYLGPFVGIFAARFGNSFGAQTALFRRMIEKGQDRHISAFVFSPGDVDWNGRRVHGSVPTENGWAKRWFPLPNVVYDRIFRMNSQEKPGARSLRYRINRHSKIKLFNALIGNKWRLHRTFATSHSLASALPSTRMMRSKSDLSEMLERYSSVYVKPILGCQGKGIVRISRSKEGYVLQSSGDGDSSSRVRAKSLAAVWSWLSKRGKVRTCLVQQGLRLATCKGRRFDVRVLVQRDAGGKWQVTGVGVRLGREGRIVSNLHAGGSALTVEKALQLSLGERAAAKLPPALEEIALIAARTLQKRCGPLGELGIDIGVDTSGRPWLIEANSRTGRTLFRKLGQTHTSHLADIRPLEFAQYLSGF